MSSRRGSPALLANASLLIVLGIVSVASAQTAPAAAQRYPAEAGLIEVMFAPDSQVRLRSSSLVDLATHALDGVDAALQSVGPYEWNRICDVPEQTLDELQSRGKANTGGNVYNLNNIYRLRIDTPGAVDV